MDVKAGTVIGAYNLGWADWQEIIKAFQYAFTLPFFIGNDVGVIGARMNLVNK